MGEFDVDEPIHSTLAPHGIERRDLMGRRDFARSLVALGTAGALGSWTESAWAGGWEKIDQQDGIVAYRKDMPGTALHAFRGTGVIHAPMEKVIWVLADNTHRTDWVDRLKRSVILERKSKYDYIVYQHFGSPPIVSDRDFVYRAQAYSKKDGSAVVDIASTTHPKAPKTVGVRGKLEYSSYRLVPRGNETYAEVVIALDPKGALPKWVVNLVQKSWPVNTLQGLRKQVDKSFVKTLAAPPVR